MKTVPKLKLLKRLKWVIVSMRNVLHIGGKPLFNLECNKIVCLNVNLQPFVSMYSHQNRRLFSLSQDTFGFSALTGPF